MCLVLNSHMWLVATILEGVGLAEVRVLPGKPDREQEAIAINRRRVFIMIQIQLGLLACWANLDMALNQAGSLSGPKYHIGGCLQPLVEFLRSRVWSMEPSTWTFLAKKHLR